MFGLSIQEFMLVAIVAILLFGKRLPEVARSLGQSYSQLRKGLQDLQSEMHQASEEVDRASSPGYQRSLTYEEDDYDAPTAPKFTPPPASTSDSRTTSSDSEETASNA